MHESWTTAARIGAVAEIADVRLLKSSFDLQKFPDVGTPLGWSLDVTPRTEFEPGEPRFIVSSRYVLTVTQASAVEDESDAVLTVIDFEMAALYELEWDDEMEPPVAAEIEAYSASTGAFALYPYARAYIQDLTARAGLPPLTLSVLRVPLDTPGDLANLDQSSEGRGS